MPLVTVGTLNDAATEDDGAVLGGRSSAEAEAGNDVTLATPVAGTNRAVEMAVRIAEQRASTKLIGRDEYERANSSGDWLRVAF